MSSLKVHTFTKGDIPAAAELLAGRQANARKTHPLLSRAYEEAGLWHEPLNRLAETAEGVTVTSEGRLLGFMLGQKNLPPQNSFMARYGEPRGGSIVLEAHAVAPEANVLAVYVEMYNHIAEEWVRHGFFAHNVQVLAADTGAHDALVTMGFGRKIVIGMRPVEPVPPPPPDSDVYIRLATAEDAEAVHLLELELDYWHSHPPMFMPVDQETNEPAWRFMETVLDNPQTPIFLAFREDEPLGMISMLRESFIGPSVRGDGHVYLYQGIVSREARAGGVGEALLSRALTWCRDQGFSKVGLHYFSGNPSGGPFWRKHGFEAVQYSMERLIDDRIAWARDWR